MGLRRPANVPVEQLCQNISCESEDQIKCYIQNDLPLNQVLMSMVPLMWRDR